VSRDANEEISNGIVPHERPEAMNLSPEIELLEAVPFDDDFVFEDASGWESVGSQAVWSLIGARELLESVLDICVGSSGEERECETNTISTSAIART
jgi:hypothetical protein